VGWDIFRYAMHVYKSMTEDCADRLRRYYAASLRLPSRALLTQTATTPRAALCTAPPNSPGEDAALNLLRHRRIIFREHDQASVATPIDSVDELWIDTPRASERRPIRCSHSAGGVASSLWSSPPSRPPTGRPARPRCLA